jgi:hypothetical protein
VYLRLNTVEGVEVHDKHYHLSIKLLSSFFAEALQACEDDTAVESDHVERKHGESWRTRPHLIHTILVQY